MQVYFLCTSCLRTSDMHCIYEQYNSVFGIQLNPRLRSRLLRSPCQQLKGETRPGATRSFQFCYLVNTVNSTKQDRLDMPSNFDQRKSSLLESALLCVHISSCSIASLVVLDHDITVNLERTSIDPSLYILERRLADAHS